MDYKKYYYLELVLFDEVNPSFHKNGYLTAEEFFLIVIWKANRAKSNIARRLLSRGKGYSNLDVAVKELTAGIFKSSESKEKLRYLIKDWGFQLPMASAILTVLYPKDFTIYDVRVCEVLGQFSEIKNKVNFESIWTDYVNFVDVVKESVPCEKYLREKDRYLWGKSFHRQLLNDIKNQFGSK